VNMKRSEWSREDNEKLERRVVLRVGEIAEELHDKYNGRFEQLNSKGTFDETINAQRAAGMFHTELLRKLKLWDLRKHVERDIHAATPNTYIESKMGGNGGFEVQLDRFIKEKDTEIERARTTQPRTLPVATPNASRLKASGRRKSQDSSERKGQGKRELRDIPAALGESQASAGSVVSGDDTWEMNTLPRTQDMQPAVEANASVEAMYEPSPERSAVQANSSEGESSDENEPSVARRSSPDRAELDDKEIRRRRRRRRRQQPPEYIEYAKMREQQLNAADDRVSMGAMGAELWVVDHPRYTGPEDGRDAEDPAPIVQGRPRSKMRNESPFTRMPQDILQPQHEKKQIGVHYKWEDINVSTNVVLRTALPSAPPRVPQLVLSESHADARTIHDLGPSIAHTTQATRPARALVSEVYTAETATLGSDEAMLPGAAPAEFRGLDARLKTPKIAKDAGRGHKREAHRDRLKAQKAQQKAARQRQEAMPTLDVAVQRRLEVVWDILQVPPMDKLDHVLKYSKVEFSGKLADSLLVWEAVAQCVQRREQLLRELNNLKNSNSALKGSKAVRERMTRLAVALCEHSRDAQQLISQLEDEFDDQVNYNGSLYETKIQSDLDEELMGLLPLGSGGEHEYGDLIRS